jgi:cobaltochelatase CobT
LVPSLPPGSLTGCAVSFLVDNSGSMRGPKIKAAAIAMHRLAGILEAASARVEVLGFTTKSWKGGQAREAWLRAGKPLNPGRLNDLRHLVYKTADQLMARASAAFAVMLREGLLKENIDGEALLWAYERLRRIRAHRRVLVLLSDGAPTDDSTLNANRPDYLNQHLRWAVRRLERRPRLDLVAVGLGYDPKKVFSNAAIAHEPGRLGSVLTRLLSTLIN